MCVEWFEDKTGESLNVIGLRIMELHIYSSIALHS
jgi:hypothetical protein